MYAVAAWMGLPAAENERAGSARALFKFFSEKFFCEFFLRVFWRALPVHIAHKETVH